MQHVKGQLVLASLACVEFSGKYHYCSGWPEIWPKGYSSPPMGDIGGVVLEIAVLNKSKQFLDALASLDFTLVSE